MTIPLFVIPLSHRSTYYIALLHNTTRDLYPETGSLPGRDSKIHYLVPNLGKMYSVFRHDDIRHRQFVACMFFCSSVSGSILISSKHFWLKFRRLISGLTFCRSRTNNIQISFLNKMYVFAFILACHIKQKQRNTQIAVIVSNNSYDAQLVCAIKQGVALTERITRLARCAVSDARPPARPAGRLQRYRRRETPDDRRRQTPASKTILAHYLGWPVINFEDVAVSFA